MKTLLNGYKFQSAEAMKNTSAGIEGCCYNNSTRILPTAGVRDKEEVPSWVTVQQNMITGVLTQVKVY
jgi:hypothetical protein